MISPPLLLLALALSLASATDEVSTCEGAPRCEAEQLREQAHASISAAHRVKLSIAAHRLRLSVFEETGELDDLCAARSDLELCLAEEEVPESLRKVVLDTYRGFLAEYEARLESCSAPKPATAKSGSGEPGSGEAAGAGSAEAGSAEPESGSAESAEVGSGEARSAELKSAEAKSAEAKSAEAKSAEPESSAPPLLERQGAGPLRLAEQSPTSQAPTDRGLWIAGATLVSLGGGLVGAGAYGITGMVTARRAGYALVDDASDGPASAEQLARDRELREEYLASSRLALSAGITGGAAVILGAALLGVSRRHRTRRGRSLAVLPASRGVVLFARF